MSIAPLPRFRSSILEPCVLPAHVRIRRPGGAFRKALLLSLAVALLLGPASEARADAVPFTADRWDLSGAEIKEHLGRTSIAGTAILRDAGFQDGVVDVDVAVTGAPGYPGLLFRMQSGDEYERVYLRPHRAGRYPDAIHYAPSFHGITGWQLYFGEGHTAGVQLPPGQWIHLRLELCGTQARLFVGDLSAPALIMDHLVREPLRGAIALMSAPDGSSYFSDFRCAPDTCPAFPEARPVDVPPGMLRDWEISPVWKAGRIDWRAHYAAQELPGLSWTPIQADEAGRIDFSRWVARPQGEQSTPDALYARTSIDASQDEVRRLRFGYSDAVSLFLNGRLLYTGRSAYRQRDPSFLGIMGLMDEVALPLHAGRNELTACVVESFGGWGLICQDGSTRLQAEGIEPLHRSARRLRAPESAVWDPRRDRFYVSNFDPGGESGADGGPFLSLLDAEGKLLQADWIGGLLNPSGLAVRGDTLYAVERTGLAVIDIRAERIARRIPIPAARFLNDIALDATGVAYVTDSGAAAIYRIEGTTAEAWLLHPALAQANGLCVAGDSLLVGCTADARVRSIRLHDRGIRTIASLPAGTMDGLSPDGHGGFLLSQVEGRIFRLPPAGPPEKILDLSAEGSGCADFAFAAGTGILVVPTWLDNRVISFRYRPPGLTSAPGN